MNSYVKWHGFFFQKHPARGARFFWWGDSGLELTGKIPELPLMGDDVRDHCCWRDIQIRHFFAGGPLVMMIYYVNASQTNKQHMHTVCLCCSLQQNIYYSLQDRG